MSVDGAVILGNEAVAALLDVRHRKHRRVLALVEAATTRRGARRMLVVPTSVRVEAGWNRQAPDAAPINRLKVLDHALDGRAADRAASIRTSLEVSIADAHLAVVLAAAIDTHTAVVTSDVGGVERIAAFVGRSPVIVRV